MYRLKEMKNVLKLQGKYIILLHLFLLAGCGIYRYSYDESNQKIIADKGNNIMAVHITEVETQESVMYKAVEDGKPFFSLSNFGGNHYQSDEDFFICT